MNHFSDSAPGTPRTVSFGPFELDFHRLALRREGRPVPLQQLRVRALCLLVARAGEVVTREEFIAALWGSTLVEYDQSLPPIIRNLREVLGDSAQQPRYIQTVRGQGYRFLAAVEGAKSEPPPRRSLRRRAILSAAALLLASTVAWVLATGNPPAPATVLVLPLTADDRDQGELMAFSISQDLEKRWGDRLQVNTVLPGDLDPDGGPSPRADYLIRGRIVETVVGLEATAEMVEVESAEILATESLQFVPTRMAPVAFLFNQALVRPLIAPDRTLAAPDDGASLALQVAFELGRGGPDNHDRALRLVRQALTADGDDARVLGLLALVQFDRWAMGLDEVAADESARAARRALDLEPGQIEPHIVLANLAFCWERRPAEGMAHLEAIAGRADDDPRYWSTLGTLELARGNLRRAAASGHRLADLIGFHPALAPSIDWLLYAAGEGNAALESTRRSLAITHPYDGSRLVRLLILEDQGRWPELAAEAESFLAMRGIPGDTVAAIVDEIRQRGESELFWQLLRQRFDAIDIKTPLYPELGAILASASHDEQRTLAYLRQAWNRHSCWLPAALQYPVFDPYRETPAFQALQQEVTTALALDQPLPS